MGRSRRSSAAANSSLPVAVSDALTRSVRTLTARLIHNVPPLTLTHRQIDDLLTSPADNEVLRAYAAKQPTRFFGDCAVRLAVLEDSPEHNAWREARRTDMSLKLPTGALSLYLDTLGVHQGNSASAEVDHTHGPHGRRFLHLRKDGTTTPMLWRREANPEHIAQLREFAAARYKAGLHANAARKFCERALTLCTTVPGLLRVWPNSLRWAGEDQDARRYLSENHDKRGRLPVGWTEAETKAVASADFLLGKASLLPNNPPKTGDLVVTVIACIGKPVHLSWGDELSAD